MIIEHNNAVFLFVWNRTLIYNMINIKLIFIVKIIEEIINYNKQYLVLK